MEDGIEHNDKRLSGKESMGSIVVEDIKSKNSFDKNSVIENYYLSYTDGAPTWDSNMAYSDFIEVEPNIDYTMSLDTASILCIHFYDSNKNWLNYELVNDNVNTSLSKKAPATAKYVRLCFGKIKKDKVQFEKGTVATNYNKHIDFDNGIVQVTDFITANDGYTILEQNIFRQGNHYFGDVVIKKNSGAFSTDSENVATLKRSIVGTVNSCSFLCGSQWANGGTGYLFIGGTSIIISDFTGNSYSFAKFHIDVVAN
jgi:hypothetical protein